MTNGQLPTNTVQQPTGIIAKALAWVNHPRFADSDPVDWFAFLVLITMAGLLWSKVVRQTLEAV